MVDSYLKNNKVSDIYKAEDFYLQNTRQGYFIYNKFGMPADMSPSISPQEINKRAADMYNAETDKAIAESRQPILSAERQLKLGEQYPYPKGMQ
jgi:hypothetical protein